MQKTLFLFQAILKLSNDFKKDNSLETLGNNEIEFATSINIDWSLVNKPLKDLYPHKRITNVLYLDADNRFHTSRRCYCIGSLEKDFYTI